MFNPKSSSNTIEINSTSDTKNQIQNINNTSGKYEDPKGVLSSEIFTIIKKEKNIRIASIIFWGIILLCSVTSIVLTYVFITRYNSNKGIGNYVIASIVVLFSLFLFSKQLIWIIGWRKIEQKYRESYSLANVAASSTFADLYRQISRKNVNLNWLFIIFMTYFIIFNLIILWFYKVNYIQIDTPQKSLFQLHVYFNVKEALDKAFGNTYLLLIIDLIVGIVLSVLFVFLKIYDKKRLQDARLQITQDNANVMTSVENSVKSLNKAWRNFYIIILVLTIFLPLAIFIYLIWKGIIKFKK